MLPKLLENTERIRTLEFLFPRLPSLPPGLVFRVLQLLSLPVFLFFKKLLLLLHPVQVVLVLLLPDALPPLHRGRRLGDARVVPESGHPYQH